MESLTLQVGGTHYKGLKVEPVQLAVEADLNFFQTSIVKYVSRYKLKNGKEDLCKSIHLAHLGHDLNAPNHCEVVQPLVKYVRENELSPEIGEILYHTLLQNWLHVVSLIEKLIEEEYGTDVPQA